MIAVERAGGTYFSLEIIHRAYLKCEMGVVYASKH
jgi:hypothetical protein